MESKKSTTYVYKIEDSAERMDDILDANDNDYEDNKSNIPTRDKLTWIIHGVAVKVAESHIVTIF